MATKPNAAGYEIGTLVNVAPGTLLMQRNIREAAPDADLINSIRDLGVLQPITAVITEAGALLVRYGHRRTLAAIKAKRAKVPVYIAGVDGTEKADEALRMIGQRDENTRRQGLSDTDDMRFIEGLAGLGYTAEQIVKQGRVDRDLVDTALTVAGSAMARKAADRYEALSLDQLAVVAEFEDDAEIVKALIVASTTGQFEHVAQRARNDRAEARAKDDVLAALAAAGVKVIETPSRGDGVEVLGGLVVSAEDRTYLSKTDHTTCPGHVAWLSTDYVDVDSNGALITKPEEPQIEEPEAPYDLEALEIYEAGEDENATDPREGIDPHVISDYDAAQAAYEEAWTGYRQAMAVFNAERRRAQRPVAVYGCQDWKEHGHHDPHEGERGGTTEPAVQMSEAEREERRVARKLVIDNNKAWTAAEAVRRTWLTTFSKAKTTPKGTGMFLATALCRDPETLHSIEGNHLAAKWLGKSSTSTYGRVDLAPAKSATEARATVLALVQVLAGYEANLTQQSWRGNGNANAVGRYLRFLTQCGYTLSEVEQYAASSKTA